MRSKKERTPTELVIKNQTEAVPDKSSTRNPKLLALAKEKFQRAAAKYKANKQAEVNDVSSASQPEIKETIDVVTTEWLFGKSTSQDLTLDPNDKQVPVDTASTSSNEPVQG